MSWWEKAYLPEIVRGLSITGGVFLKNMGRWMTFRKGALTTYYPEETRPDYARNNRPERLESDLARYRARELFPAFPFGTDLTPEEVVLRKALRKVKRMVSWNNLQLPSLAVIGKTIATPHDAHSYLKRMALDRPRSFKERLLQRAVIYALASVDAI